MKLDRKKMLLISFMLFSLFFGAGNLIFPPFLGQNAGSSTVSAMLGFLATAVILPVLGVIVVVRFDGLEQLAQHAGKKFSLIFTIHTRMFAPCGRYGATAISNGTDAARGMPSPGPIDR